MNASALARSEGFELQSLEALPAFVQTSAAPGVREAGLRLSGAGEPPFTYAFVSHWGWGPGGGPRGNVGPALGELSLYKPITFSCKEM